MSCLFSTEMAMTFFRSQASGCVTSATNGRCPPRCSATTRAVDPYLRGVVRRADAQEHALPAPAGGTYTSCRYQARSEVVARVVEEVIPTARHGDRARRGQRLEPALRLAFLFRVELELPEPGKVEQVADVDSAAGRASRRVPVPWHFEELEKRDGI